MRNYLKEFDQKIEEKTQELTTQVNELGLNDNKVLETSKELDHLLNEHQYHMHFKQKKTDN